MKMLQNFASHQSVVVEQSVCIYLDPDAASQAAAVVRRSGLWASVKVEPIRNWSSQTELYVIKTQEGARQRVIDAIAEAVRRRPRLEEMAMRCPHCQSVRVQYPEYPMEDAPLTLVDRVEIGLRKLLGEEFYPHFHCQNCGEHWEADELESLSKFRSGKN